MQRRKSVKATLATVAFGALLSSSVGFTQDSPCVDFCAQIAQASNSLRSEVNKQQILHELERANSDNAAFRYGGYGAKALSYVAGALSSGAELAGPGVPGVGEVAGALEAPLSDAAQYLAGVAQENVAKAIVIKLNQKVGDVIYADGRLNTQKLAQIGNGELSFVYSPRFRAEIGDPRLLDSITDRITAAQLSAVLKGTTVITETLPVMREKLELLDEGMSTLKGQMTSLSTQSKRTERRLGVVEGKVDRASSVIDAIAKSNLRPAQVLALSRAGALSVSLDEEMRLQTLADAQQMEASLKEAHEKMTVVAAGLHAFHMDEAFNFLNTADGLFQSAGTLAVAYTTGDVWGGAQAAISLVGQIGGLGKKKKKKENAMMKALFDQIREMRKDMKKYHDLEMAKLNTIDGKLDDLQRQLQQSTSRLQIDIAEVRFGISELLSHDVGKCQLLQDEFQSAAGRINSRVDFARWFESDGRNLRWRECMVGLEESLKVRSETFFASYLLAQPEDVEGAGISFDDPRVQIRAFQEGVLQPTVAFAKKHRSALRRGGPAMDLFTPILSVCEVAGVPMESRVCQSQRARKWRRSGLPPTTFNPGNGNFVSDERVLALARYARTIATWNTALVERPSRSVPTVIADPEWRSFSAVTMGRRTRHLQVLRSSLDALDLVIGQSEVVAGAPFIAFAVDELEQEILPAYARLRLLGDEKPLWKLLEPGIASPYPLRLPKCATGAPAFDTLCLMQTNRWFAENVIRGLVVRRLAAQNMDAVAWNAAARLPVSVVASNTIGNDVLLADASIRQTSSSFGVWAIQLPRLGIRREPNNAEPSSSSTDCWSGGAVPEFKSAEEFKTFYAKAANASCYMVPLASNGGLDRMQFPSDLFAVVAERMQVVSKLKALCQGLRTYPDYLCAEFRQASAHTAVFLSSNNAR